MTAETLPNKQLVKYLRLKVRNVGVLPAQNVSISVTRIGFTPIGGVAREFREEVLDLKLAMTGDHPFRIPSQGHRFVDLFRATANAGPDQYGFDFVRHSVRLFTFGFGAGTYEADIFASADDAPSIRGVAKWTWGGSDLDGLQILHFREIV